MSLTTLHVKNMVCNRCIKVIQDEFDKLGIVIESIKLGEIDISQKLNKGEINTIKEVLETNGFELIDDKKSQIIDSIRTLVVEITHYNKEVKAHTNYSDFIAQELGYDYSYLSHLFSSAEGITIEKYFILQKVERVKELLEYNELSLKEIAHQQGYSSVQHLSNQFKKITGLSPSHFKKLKEKKRLPLDEL